MIQTLSYGELPKYEQFEVAFNSYCLSGVFRIRNCPILDAVYPGGSVDLTMEQTWAALEQARDGWKDNHELGDIAEHILNHLGFDWV